jgi:hypothetical protein
MDIKKFNFHWVGLHGFLSAARSEANNNYASLNSANFRLLYDLFYSLSGTMSVVFSYQSISKLE